MFNTKAQTPLLSRAPTLILDLLAKRHASLLKLCNIKSEAVIALLSMKPSNVLCMCDMGPPYCCYGVVSPFMYM